VSPKSPVSTSSTGDPKNLFIAIYEVITILHTISIPLLEGYSKNLVLL
jgi:hypothetical protein